MKDKEPAENKPAPRHRTRPRSIGRRSDAEVAETGKAASTRAPRPTARRGESGPAQKETSGDYEVGYGKPPKHSQFRPGQSGNPRGRKSGTRNLKTAIEEVLKTAVPVSYGGKKKNMRLIDALLANLARKGVGGELAPARLLIETAIRLGAFPEDGTDIRNESNALAPEEQQRIDSILHWMQNGTAGERRDKSTE